MDPQSWLCADQELENRLKGVLEWFDSCEEAIKNSRIENVEVAKQLKIIFLSCVNLSDINEYLSYYRPHKLPINKLIQIEEEAMICACAITDSCA